MTRNYILVKIYTTYNYIYYMVYNIMILWLCKRMSFLKKKYKLNYLGVKCHGICSLLSNGSEKCVCICVERIKQMWQNVSE